MTSTIQPLITDVAPTPSTPPVDLSSTAISTYTPLPTLPPTQLLDRVLVLLQNNNGCDLPCWWGILPGNTTWLQAWSFLSQFDSSIYVAGNTKSRQFANIQIAGPEQLFPASHLALDIEILNGLVHIINAYGFDNTQAFSLQQLLSSHGQPLEVWIHTYRSYLGGIPPVDVLLFYPDQGILARYSTELTEIDESGDSASICLDHSPSLTLWSPDERIDFDQAQDYARLDYKEYSKPLLSLESATGITLDEFYSYRSKAQVCLSTKLSLWPEP